MVRILWHKTKTNTINTSKEFYIIVIIITTLIGLKYPIKLFRNTKNELNPLQVNVGHTLTSNVSGNKGPINVLLIGNNARNAANPCEPLREAFYDLKKKAAAGVDKITAEEYAKELENNLGGLEEQLKSKQYRAKLVRRVYIDKGDERKDR
jgi:hypothetical protein